MTEFNDQLAPESAEAKLAQALYRAYQNKEPLTMADWTDKVQDEPTAYKVQHELMKLKGQPLGGYKVSLTSEQTQKMFDSTEPLYGAQVQSHFVQSPVTLALKTDLMDPLAEVELVLRLKKICQLMICLRIYAKKHWFLLESKCPTPAFRTGSLN